jgi:hypothetical protein
MEEIMLLKKCLVALGFAGLIAIAAPAPTFAEGVYLQGPGFGVDIGRSGRVGVDIGRHRDRDFDRPRYRDRYGDRYDRYERRYGGGCKTITIERDDGSVRRARRCDG